MSASRPMQLCIVTLLSATLASCDPEGGSDSFDGGNRALEINIQVTGAENLEVMMEELEARGIPATVWLSSVEIEDNCEYVDTLAETHEIAGKYPGQIEEDTPTAPVVTSPWA